MSLSRPESGQRSRIAPIALSIALSFTVSVAAHASIQNALPAECVPAAAWVSLQSQSSARAAPEFIAELAGQRAVLLGETHSNADHHRWQLDTISALYAQRPDMVLAFEMFPRRAQEVLNRWVAGELSEAEFLKQTDWETVWNYDAALYLPIFHFARVNRIPMLALNIDRNLIGKISEVGWEEVPLELREGVSDPAVPSDAYVQYLYNVFVQHTLRFKTKLFEQSDTHLGPNAPNFRRFLAGQLAWDRAMAEGISMIARSNGAPLIVGLIGSGHLMYRYGVPHQLAALGIDRTSVVLPWDPARNCNELQPELADAVFGIGAPTLAQVKSAMADSTDPEVNDSSNVVTRVSITNPVETADIVTP